MHKVIGVNMKTVVGLVLIALPILAQDQKITLKEGAEVRLKFAEPLSSKTAVTDDVVGLLLDDDLKVGGIVVARAGCKALATVSNSKKAGMLGKGGELNIRMDYLRVGDNKVRLRGTKAREGESKQTTAIVLTVLLGPVGLIKHGRDVSIVAGASLLAYVADDVVLAPVGQ